jgi:hypothetical protein
MLDKVGNFFTLLLIGAIAVRMMTNKNSATTLGTVFHGVAEDVHAATG